MKILKISAVLLLLNTFFIYPENIRGPVINIIDAEKLADPQSSVEFDLSAEELLQYRLIFQICRIKYQ